jgi:hypothetical protein
MTDFWLPTINFCRWMGKKQKHTLGLMWSMRNFLRCQQSVLTSFVDIVTRNTTCSAIQHSFVQIGDSYVHFGWGEYHLTLPHLLTTGCPSDWSVFLIPDHPENCLITHLPPSDHFPCIQSPLIWISESTLPLYPSHFPSTQFTSSDLSGNEGGGSTKRVYFHWLTK